MKTTMTVDRAIQSHVNMSYVGDEDGKSLNGLGYLYGVPVSKSQKKKSIYLIGSLKNPGIPVLENELNALGFDTFAAWYGAGPNADDFWQEYEKGRGHSYKEALAGYAAQMIFHFDKTHLDRCDLAVLLFPAGKSGHLELGYFRGLGKPGYILMDKEPDRYDVMHAFATGVYFNKTDFFKELRKYE